jgi:hypothetical protein
VDFANGFVYASLPAQDSVTIEMLRIPALQVGGYVVVTHIPESWQGMVDKWGYVPETGELMKVLKERWDPQGILGDR